MCEMHIDPRDVFVISGNGKIRPLIRSVTAELQPQLNEI